MLAGEIELTRGRLATLGAVLVDRPTDIEVSAEVRGLQRVLIALIAAQAKHVTASPVQVEPRGLTDAGLRLLLGEEGDDGAA